MTADMVAQWVDLYSHELDQTGSHIQSSSEILASLQARVDAMQAIADCVYTKWAEPILLAKNSEE